MNEEMVRIWNETVGPDDVVWHLGDVAVTDEALEEFVPRLNGTKLLVKGNYESDRSPELLDKLFWWSLNRSGRPGVINPGRSVDHGVAYGYRYPDEQLADSGFDKHLWVCHYPKQRHQHLFTLTGHIHDLWKVARDMLNVGVDAWHFRPVSMDIVLEHRICERDGRWDANVYPDASLAYQLHQSTKIPRGGDEPTMTILREQIERAEARNGSE